MEPSWLSFPPDFSQVSKYADWWIPANAGQDGALWMAVNHVLLKEFHADRQVPYFINYLKRYSDASFLVVLQERNGTYAPGRLLRAKRLTRYRDVENGDWKFVVFDKGSHGRGCPGVASVFAGRRKGESGIWR